jgi:hypothetical protein
VSFVKDDHSFTRGVGAIAATDAASPRRRMAADRAALVLARRDAVMARSTLGRAPVITSPATGQFGIRTLEVDSFGRGAGGLKPHTPGGTGGGRPPGKTPGGKGDRVPGKPTRPLREVDGKLTKLPGSVLTAPSDDRRPPPTPSRDADATKSTKPTVMIVGGGGSSPGGGGGGRATPPPELFPDAEVMETEFAPEPTAAKPTNKLLLYAALGLGAWLLLRGD